MKPRTGYSWILVLLIALLAILTAQAQRQASNSLLYFSPQSRWYSRLSVAVIGDQQPFCQACQAARWDSLDNELLRRAENLKRARALLWQAQTSGNPALIKRARDMVARTTAEWNYIDGLATKLQSASFKTFLARHQVDADARYDQARVELHKKTEQLDRLRHALEGQKQSEFQQMKSYATEEAKERQTLAIDSGLGAIKAAAFNVDLSLRLLKSIPSGAIDWTPEIQRLERLSAAAKTIKSGKMAYDVYKSEYWKASVGASQTVLALIIPKALTSEYKVFLAEAAKTRLTQLTAYPFFVTVGLDYADIGLSHVQFREAEARLRKIGDLEKNWQLDLQIAAARVKNVAAERDLASDALRRQAQLEAQIATIRQELSQ
jgi:hypothetical protein